MGLEWSTRPILLKMALSFWACCQMREAIAINTWTQLSMNHSPAWLISAYQELNNIVQSTGRNALRWGQGSPLIRQLPFQGGLLSLIRLVSWRISEFLETSGYPLKIYMFIRLPCFNRTSLWTARVTKIGIKVIWIQTRRTASDSFPNSCNLGTKTINKSCQVTGRHIEKSKGPIVGYTGAIVENVKKEKEAPN